MAEVNLTGNSHLERDSSKEGQKNEKRFSAVTETPAVISEKKGLKKALALLAPADAALDIKNDVVIPAVRNVLSDICGGFFDVIEDSINAVLFPGSKRGRRTRRDGYVPYGSYYRYSSDSRDRRGPVDRDYARPSRAGFDLDAITLRTRGEAETVLYAMDEAVSRYGFVTVGDVFDLSGVSTVDIPHTAYKYGWTDIRPATVVPTRGGFTFRFPKYVPID